MSRSLFRLCAVVLACLSGVQATGQGVKPPMAFEAVPGNGFAFVTINVAQLHDSEQLKPFLEALNKSNEKKPFLKEIETRLGLAASEIERATLFWPEFLPQSSTPLVLLTTRKAYNEAKFLKAVKAISPRDNPGRHHPEAFPPKAAYPLKSDAPFPAKDAPPFPAKGGVPMLPKGPLEQFPPKGPIDERKHDAPQAGAPLPHSFVRFQAPQPAAPESDSDRSAEIVVSPELDTAIVLLDDRNLLFVPRDSVNGPDGPLGLISWSAKLLKRKPGALSEALAIGEKHTVVGAIDVRPLRAIMLAQSRGELPRELVPYKSLTQVNHALFTFDFGVTSKANAKLTFANADDAKRAEPVLKTVIQLASEEMAQERKRMAKEKEADAAFGPIVDLAIGAVNGAEVKLEGAHILVSSSAEIGPAVQKAIAALPVWVNLSASQTTTMNNLKQLMLAVHNYHDSMGIMPQDIVDKNGKPILSWRVQLLPYIEQDNLFRKLDLTKAWDDPANAKVLAQMPKVFNIEGREAAPGFTYFQMFTAPKFIPGGSPVLVPGVRRGLTSITDGTSNTLGIVEGAEAVHWAKPGDILFDPKKLPKVGNAKTGKFFASMLDGSVRVIRLDKLTDDALRALITVDGGEVVDIPR